MKKKRETTQVIRVYTIDQSNADIESSNLKCEQKIMVNVQSAFHISLRDMIRLIKMMLSEKKDSSDRIT